MSIYVKRIQHEVFIPKDELMKVAKQHLGSVLRPREGSTSQLQIIVPNGAKEILTTEGVTFKWEEKKGE